MTQLQSMNCPTCGAPLTISGNEIEVTCTYCGNTVMVPQEMRHAVPRLADLPTLAPPGPLPFRAVQPSAYNYRPDRSLRASGCITMIVILFIGLAILIVGLQQSGADLSGLIGAIGGITGLGSPVVASFGGEGTGAGLFNDPNNIAIDGNDYIYVSDLKTGRIQRFDPTGKYVRAWDVPRTTGTGPDCLAANRAGDVYACQGSSVLKYNGASGELLSSVTVPKFAFLYSAAALLNGNLIACDCLGSDEVIYKFDANGKIIGTYDKPISSHEEERVSFPHVAVDGLGNLFVLDPVNNHVFLFDANGIFLTRYGSTGHGTDQLDFSGSIAVDSQSNIYVSDRGVIKVFDKNWHYLHSFRMPTEVYTVKSMAFNSAGALFALGYDKKVYKINVGSGQ